jgi:hypothetical protein
MFAFLRAIGLNPIEWNKALAAAGSASPYIGEVLDTAFDMAQAIVVLMTPDEMAYLLADHASGLDDPDTKASPQARPNVLSRRAWRWAAIQSARCLSNSGHCARSATLRDAMPSALTTAPRSGLTWRIG